MLGRKKLGYKECLCRWCAPSGSGHRKYIKSRFSNRATRKLGQREIREQYEDYRYGIDPD